VPSDQAQQVASYSDPALPVAPALLQALTQFLNGAYEENSDAVPQL
jgi:hypothetical protein